MLARTTMALAGSAMIALALPAGAKAQTVYIENDYGYSDYGYSNRYAEPYGWGSGPFWPIGAAAGLAAGIVGTAANVVAAPFVGWRDGYYVDQRIDPAGYSYGYGYDRYGYDRYADGYGYDRGYYRATPGAWGGYVATYRGKVKAKHPMMHQAKAKPMKHTKHQGRMAAR